MSLAAGSKLRPYEVVGPLGAGVDTEGTTYPFWLPDGRYLAFFAHGKLKKLEI